MSFDKLKGYKSYGSSSVSETPVNPYTKKKPATAIGKTDENSTKISEEDKLILSNSLLEGQNKYLASRVFQQEREIKTLREDIASLYAMLENLGVEEISEQESRELYYSKFRVDKRHLRSRINKKIMDEDSQKINNE